MSKKNKIGTLKSTTSKPIPTPAAALKFKKTSLFDIEPDSNLVKKLFIGSFIFMFVAMSLMSFNYGISGDEFSTNVCGKLALNYYKTFGADTSIFNIPKSIDRDNNLKLYGDFFFMLTAVLNKISPLNEFTNEHLVNSWAGFLMIVFTSLIIAKILNKKAAIFGAWLLFLSPFVLGHSMNNPKDIPFATSFIVGIYFIIRFVENIHHLKIKDYVFIILAFAMSIGSRAGGLILIPLLVVYIVIQYLYAKWYLKQNYQLSSLIIPCIIVSVLGYLLCGLFWPFALENPLVNPIKALKLMTNFDVRILQLFQGVKMYPESDYLILNLLYTNSLPVILGVLCAMPFIWKFRHSPQAPLFYFIIFATIFPLVYIIYKKSVVYHAWRHILFIAPGIIIIATFGWYALNDYLQKKFQLKIKYLGWILCGIFLLEPTLFIIRSFPNTVTYYNAFVGGTSQAYGYYEMDSYGNSVKQEADWFIKNELPKIKPTEHKILVTNYIDLVREYLKPYPNIEVQYIRFNEKNDRYWDYALFHVVINMPVEQIQKGTWISKTPLHITSVFGKPLCVTFKRASLDDMKGLDYLKKNNADSALYHFNKYLALEPKDNNILNNAANIYVSLNDLSNANKLVDRSLEIDNTDAFANYLKGNILARQNNTVASNFYLGKYNFYIRNYQEAYKLFSNCLGTDFAAEAEKFIADIENIVREAEIEQQRLQEKEAENAN
ncbi:MAG: glycosyltransferase family 39 protein [Alphaproteobacteria bacterium]|nr:glycosyltransferase family 39 protein [Alphaproteobacteria bacterium]